MRRTAILVAALAGCGGGSGSVLVGDRWSAADALFHQDPRWLGGEGGASIDLGGQRSLWLFGDTFIANDAANPTRRASTLVHNSYGVMSGNDPTTATMTMHWPLVADIGDDWLRPISAVMVPSTGEVVVFLVQYRSGPGPGATVVGTRVLHDPLGTQRVSELISDHVIGACAAVTDDDSVIALSIDEAGHGNFVTFDAAFATATWAASDAIFRDVPADCTLRNDATVGWTLGYANRDGVIAYRWAASVTGPWSVAMPMWTPPSELRRDATIYSAFLHPMTIDGEGVSATYVDRPADVSALLDPGREGDVYWPHFLQVEYDMVVE